MSFSAMALSSLRSTLLPKRMEEQSSSDFSLTSWIQYFYIPAFFTLGTLETVLIGEVENDEDAIGLLEIVFGQGEELLLSCCVPDAYSDFVIVDCDYFLFETEPEGRGVKVTE